MNIFTASRVGDLKEVKLQIEMGVDVNSRSDDFRTALMSASAGGHLDVIKYLISQGADVNAKCQDGNTALILSCYFGHFEVSVFLVENGADIHVKNAISWSLLRLTAMRNNPSSYLITKFLIEHGLCIDFTLRDAGAHLFHSENFNLTRFLLKNGIAIQGDSFLGKSALELVLEKNSYSCLLLLVKYSSLLYKEDKENLEKIRLKANFKKHIA